jgi:GGDEF domain-containing protein
MNGLRLWVLVLVVWLPLMVSIEHSLVPAAYQHNILLFLLSTVTVVLLAPKPLPNRYVLLGFVLAFIGVGILQNGIEDELRNPFLTATRVGAIVLTGLIAHQINIHLYEIERAISAFAFTDFLPWPVTFSDAQTQLYRELQRARHHERPLSLVVLQVDAESMKTAIPRVAEEVRQSMAKRFVFAKFAQVLDDNLPRFHSFALRDDCFIAAMPETTASEAAELIQSIGAIAARDIGLTVYAGVASLSDEATTFEALVELAEQKMAHARTVQQSTDPRQLLFPIDPPSVERQAEL